MQHPCFGSARLGGERGTFCFGKKYPKTIAPVAVISTTSCCLDCPCRSPIARRRELLLPCSRTCAPCSCDRHRDCGTANGAFVASLPAIHGLRRSRLPTRRSWMTDNEATLFKRLCTTPSIAAPSGSKARMFEAMDGRVRAGPLGARSAGKFRQHDVAETVVPGAMVFRPFLPKQKGARSLASETALSQCDCPRPRNTRSRSSSSSWVCVYGVSRS